MKTIRIPKVSGNQKHGFVFRVAESLYTQIDSPIARRCLTLLKEGKHIDLVNMDIDPCDYKDAYTFSLDYQAVSFLKKYPMDIKGIDRQKVALEKVLQAESQCRDTNEHLRERLKPFSGIAHRAQQICAFILGDLPTMDGSYRFGPGATSAVRGSDVTIPDKLEKHLVCPEGSLKLLHKFHVKSNPKLISHFLGIDSEGPYSPVAPEITYERLEWNELCFVPKSAKTDRPICIEPHSLVPLQKYLGGEIRWRLLKGGIDLNKQHQVNAKLAEEGSTTSAFATLDLSSASDTISIATVAELIPFPWFDMLSQARSPFTKLPSGELIENEKFSSMGNGFTFELESLIFYSIARAVCESLDCYALGKLSVYGDDIIVPTEATSLLTEVLEAYGFSLNREKSFSKGPFRESCGSDFFNGHNVRPYFIKEEVLFEHEKFKIHNGLRHWCHRLCGGISCDYLYFKSLLDEIIQSIPRTFRLAGPSHLGDACLHVTRAEAHKYDMRSRKDQFGKATCYTAVYVPRKVELYHRAKTSLGAIQSVLYGVGSTVPIRGQGFWVIKKAYPAFWPD